MFSVFPVLHSIPSAGFLKRVTLSPPGDERSHCQSWTPGTVINCVYCNLPDTLAEHVASTETQVSRSRHVYWCELG